MADNNFTQLPTEEPENNFLQLPEEAPENPEVLDDIAMGIQSHLDSSRSLVSVFEFLITKMKSFVVAYLGGSEQPKK